ncbi:outer membrane protein assembly factor BamE [Piscinibacter koreensis]|uniref:Outer membrane protein assembly factor BamE n=1 Tax=Piscinibacter koreensis TaxID=2742824 RepID=A0A7Y6TV67_9BURK|nr:outer membrane protein assembly factor BamE [Schlegelella koreensis]NUZ04774.1 outer membrane protein assembly factor BamE [Schlegelella koreensis]
MFVARPLRGAAAALLAALAASGCSMMLAGGPRPTEAALRAIQPGMSRQNVLDRVGPPTWAFGVRQENLTIWNYRYNRADCIIYQVSLRPDGTVRDIGTAWDPACDAPSRS